MQISNIHGPLPHAYAVAWDFAHEAAGQPQFTDVSDAETRLFLPQHFKSTEAQNPRRTAHARYRSISMRVYTRGLP